MQLPSQTNPLPSLSAFHIVRSPSFTRSAMALPAVAPSPRMYVELMADPSGDPCAIGSAVVGDPVPGYQAIFARWRVSANPPTASRVHADLLTNFDLPVGGVGYFVDDGKSATGILKVTHGYRAFAGIPTRALNRGKTFGYVGDVVGGSDLDTFELDPAQLGKTVAVPVALTPELHLELLTAAPGEEAVGPLVAPAQACASVVTRMGMYIPYGLMEYVLDKDLTARQAFEVLWPMILSKGWRDHAKPLVNFLMVASTLHTVGAAPRTWNAALGLGMVGAADVLSEHRERVLYQQLPALRPGRSATSGPPASGHPGDPNMAALIAEVSRLNDHNRIEREDRQDVRDRAALPKTVHDKFQDYITDKLLSLTDCYHEDDLPRVYHELAARQKGVSKRLVLQQAYDIASGALKLNRLPASPSHVLCLDQWDFVGVSMDSLGTGLLPFSIVPPDAPSRSARKALLEEADRARQYDMSGEAVAGAISAADAKRLYNTTGYIATEWAEADIQLELYGVLLGTVLGTTHVVTVSHIRAFRYYERIRTRLQTAVNRKVGSALGPALLVLHFQLQYRSWFEERFTYGQHDNAAPDVVTGLTLFITANRLDWLPGHEDIPALVALGGAAPPRPQPPLPGGRVGAPGAGGAVPPRVLSPPAAAANAPQAERVQNAHRDPRYTGNTPLAANIKRKNVRLVIRDTEAPPPTVERGGRSMSSCLSWHLKGMCAADCHRVADHVVNSEEEKEALWMWTQVAYA